MADHEKTMVHNGLIEKGVAGPPKRSHILQDSQNVAGYGLLSAATLRVSLFPAKMAEPMWAWVLAMPVSCVGHCLIFIRQQTKSSHDLGFVTCGMGVLKEAMPIF